MDAQFTDEAEELRQLIREAHEMIKASREERKRLEQSLDVIKQIVQHTSQETMTVALADSGNEIKLYQDEVEKALNKRFDAIVEGPIRELEELIKGLYKVHSVVPMEVLSRNPPPFPNPLFKKQ